MHVVEELRAVAERGCEDRMPPTRLGQVHLGPSDMRHWQAAGEFANPAGQESDAPRMRRLLALLEEQLKSEADTEDGPPGVGHLPDRLAQAGRAERARALSEVPHSGDEHPICPAHLVWISGELSPVAARPQRSNHAREVVHPVVDNHDHNVPLVEGTPATRGSWLVAPSSARAKALNAASTM